VASGGHSTVGGGDSDTASSDNATVGGGERNSASGFDATVGGGQANRASGFQATVGGGIWNASIGDSATIGGGGFNAATGVAATVGGGVHDSATAYAATVPGGRENRAAGVFSFAAGYRAKAAHNGCFVWADSTSADFVSTGRNQFLIRASGGVGIGTDSPTVLLHVNGSAGNNTGVWSNVSDRRLKKEIEPIRGALGTVEQLQGVSFRWKDSGKDAEYGRVRGLIAQDVEKVIPEWVKTDPNGYRRLEPIGVDALLIEAIKELHTKTQEIERLTERLAQSERETRATTNSLESRLAALESRLATLGSNETASLAQPVLTTASTGATAGGGGR
jgi:hypothetical protein